MQGSHHLHRQEEW